MNDKYLARGVSAGKEEIHAAVRHLDHGLFPKAFCKVYPDSLAGDDGYCNLMSSDGSGTKSALAYLCAAEMNDPSIFAGIAQDAIVMNLDDLLCVGATNNFLFSSVINRNKTYITGEMISAIIKGSKEFFDKMLAYGIHIQFMGGETADLGDVVRTITVDATMVCRMKKSDLLLTDNIAPGNVIIGLASYGQTVYETEYNSGIGSNGLTSARHDLLHKYYADKYPETFDPTLDSSVVYCGTKKLDEPLEGTPLTIGKALLSPTRTLAPVIKTMLEKHPKAIRALIHNTGGAHTKSLHYIPNNIRILKDNLLPVPPIFKLIQQESKTDWKEMYKVFNCGTKMELYCAQEQVDNLLAVAESFGVQAQVIGSVVASEGKSVEISSEHGTFEYHG